jgi:putative transposase
MGHGEHPPPFIRDTNTVESLHMQIRKTIKTRAHFPNDDAALRLIWLAIMRAKTNWRTCYNWTTAMAVLPIHFGDRIPDNT